MILNACWWKKEMVGLCDADFTGSAVVVFVSLGVDERFADVIKKYILSAANMFESLFLFFWFFFFLLFFVHQSAAYLMVSIVLPLSMFFFFFNVTKIMLMTWLCWWLHDVCVWLHWAAVQIPPTTIWNCPKSKCESRMDMENCVDDHSWIWHRCMLHCGCEVRIEARDDWEAWLEDIYTVHVMRENKMPAALQTPPLPPFFFQAKILSKKKEKICKK